MKNIHIFLKIYYDKWVLLMNKISSIKSSDELILAKKFHNIKNSLFVISGYITIGEYDKALEKISEICNDFTENNNLSITGNSIIDSLIRCKKNTAMQHNIEINCKNKLKFSFNIDELDFCIALGNALDNAIEACVNLSANIKRYINIEFFSKSDNYICVEISNPVENIIPVVNNYIYSTKRDNFPHGFGIISMKEITQKYGGKIEFKQKNNTFYVRLIFKNEDF